jgi:hypothetical protein
MPQDTSPNDGVDVTASNQPGRLARQNDALRCTQKGSLARENDALRRRLAEAEGELRALTGADESDDAEDEDGYFGLYRRDGRGRRRRTRSGLGGACGAFLDLPSDEYPDRGQGFKAAFIQVVRHSVLDESGARWTRRGATRRRPQRARRRRAPPQRRDHATARSGVATTMVVVVRRGALRVGYGVRGRRDRVHARLVVARCRFFPCTCTL